MKIKYFIKKYIKYVSTVFSDHKEYINFSVYALIIFFIIGVIFKNAFIEEQKEFIEYIVAQLEGKNFLETWLFIFFHNFWANLITIFLGFTLFYPFITISVNGFLIGAVLAKSIIEKGFIVSIALLLPHGIFEIPAILLSLALSFKIGTSFVKKKEKWYIRYYNNYKKAFIIFLRIVVPLLLIASFIETIVSSEINFIF